MKKLETDMKNSEILKEARKLLWDGKESQYDGKFRHICDCILIAGDRNAPSNKELRKTVTCKIKGYFTYETYLFAILGEEEYDKLTSREIQAGRFKLLDELIAEYEAQGD
jgi:hypothetical protein